MKKLSALLAFAMLLPLADAAQALKEQKRPVPATPSRRHDEKTETQEPRPVRSVRPITLSVSGLAKTPFAGFLVDANFLPYAGVGVGFGYFSVNSVSGNFIPVFAHLYPLRTNLSPYVAVGANFVTVKFQSSNSLLNSTFKGTQFIVGPGLEYRFDFGLVLRAEGIRFLNAKIWSPGASVGYSIAIE